MQANGLMMKATGGACHEIAAIIARFTKDRIYETPVAGLFFNRRSSPTRSISRSGSALRSWGPSQFSREYRRQFGIPPQRDVGNMRGAIPAAAA
jgi:hypothetical protein